MPHFEFDSPPPRPPAVGPWTGWSPWRVLGLAALLLAGNFFLQILVYGLGGGLYLPVLAGAIGGVFLPLAWLAKRHSWRPAADLGLDQPPGRILGLGVLMAIAAMVPTSFLAEASLRLHPVDPSWAILFQENLPRSGSDYLFAVLSVVLAGPLAEELIFRGLVQRLATGAWGSWPGIIVSALVFAVVHGEPWYLLGLVGVGVVLGLIYESTRSVTACWATHAVYNAISLGTMIGSGAVVTEPSTITAWDWLLCGVSLAAILLLLKLLRAAATSRKDAVRVRN